MAVVDAGKKSGYLPSLDGWRAIAIASVFMTHDLPWRLGPLSNAGWKGNGVLGVYLFFAISGLLITWRICEEEKLSGSFHIKSFYIRRFFRIQPASFVYLGFLAVLMSFGVIHLPWRMWLGSLFTYQNFLIDKRSSDAVNGTYIVGHFWSLCVEEHFYLVLSLFFLTVRRFRIVLLFLLYGLLHVAQNLALARGLYQPELARQTQWLIQYLLFPSLLALLLRLDFIRAGFERWLSPWVAFGGTLVLILARYVHSHSPYGFWSVQTFAGDYGMLLKAFSFWVVSTMLHPRSWTTKFLELRPLRYLGRLSYSIYLWHLIFLAPPGMAIRTSWRPWAVLSSRPWNYLVVAVFVLASYYLIEKPLIRIGHRLAPAAPSGGREDASEQPERSFGTPQNVPAA